MSNDAKSTTDPSASKASTAPWWKSVLLNRWVLILVVGSLLVDFAVLVSVRKSAAKPVIEPEYTVGNFTFKPAASADSQPTFGKFALHVRFIEDLDGQARQQIVTHQYRVQEAVEGLLRKANGIELDDTAVTRLKHQIQQRIDDCLDLRAVAEVIITDLNVDSPSADGSSPPAKQTASHSAGSSPTDKPAVQPTAATPSGEDLGSVRN